MRVGGPGYRSVVLPRGGSRKRFVCDYDESDDWCLECRVQGLGFGVQSSGVCVLGMVMVKRGGGGHRPSQFSVPTQIN